MKLREMRDRLSAISKRMKEIHDTAEKDSRGLNKEENEEWDRLTNEHSELSTRAKRAELVETNQDNSPSDRLQEQRDRQEFREKRHNEDDPNAPLTEYQQLVAMRAWAIKSANPQEQKLLDRMGISMSNRTLEMKFDRGMNEFGVSHKAPKSQAEVNEQRAARVAFRDSELRRELASFESRAQSIGTPSAGGYTVPDEMMRSIESAMLQFGGMRQVSTILTTSTGADLPIPTSNDTSNKAEIIGEGAAINEQDIAFGQVVLQAYKYSTKYLKVSVELLQDSVLNLPSFIGSALGERAARGTNAHFTTGTGTGQPRGIVTAAANSSVTTASNTALTYDEILSLKHSVDPAYRQNAAFMVKDALLLIMKKMKDGQDRPLWLPSLLQGEPSTFDGDPVIINQDMPSGAASKAMIYGDFSKYYIRDTHAIELMRLDELFALNHQVAFLGFGRWDGDLIDAGTGPVKYLTLAA